MPQTLPMIIHLTDYLTLSITSEVICFCTALLCLTGKQNGYWRWMILFLAVTCIVEISGQYIVLNIPKPNNNWIYNVHLFFEILFMHLFFAHLFKPFAVRNLPIMIFSTCLTLLFGFLTELYIYKFTLYCNYTFTILSVILVLYSLLYYYYLFKNDFHIDLKFSPEFWWVAGNLFFYFGNTVGNVFYEYFGEGFYPFLYYSVAVLNVLMYGCWAYSFFCKKWMMKR